MRFYVVAIAFYLLAAFAHRSPARSAHIKVPRWLALLCPAPSAQGNERDFAVMMAQLGMVGELVIHVLGDNRLLPFQVYYWAALTDFVAFLGLGTVSVLWKAPLQRWSAHRSAGTKRT